MLRAVELLSRRRLLDDVFKVDEATMRYERSDGTLSQPVRRLSFERGDAVGALVIEPATRKVMQAA